MTHKWSWLIILAVAAGSGVAGGYLVRVQRGAPQAAAADPTLVQRLERLEAETPELKRGLAQAGAQMGVMALSAAAAAGTRPDPEAEAAAAEVAEAAHAARERAHYDRLDQLVRTGGGVKAAAHLRKNIEAAKGDTGGRGALDVASLDCSDTLCRVEVRDSGSGKVAAISSAGLRVLGPGMGPLTMRPYEKGRPLVFYLAAPGQDLPAFDF